MEGLTTVVYYNHNCATKACSKKDFLVWFIVPLDASDSAYQEPVVKCVETGNILECLGTAEQALRRSRHEIGGLEIL